MNTKPVKILLVEDNENDVILTREGFIRSKFAVDLHHVWDGEECMAYLRREGRFANESAPDMVLLDLNMPRMDGREVMAEIAADPALCHLPVLILTTSAEESEILKMYRLRCSSYIVKPVSFASFIPAIQSLANYWFTVVVFPSPPTKPGQG